MQRQDRFGFASDPLAIHDDRSRRWVLIALALAVILGGAILLRFLDLAVNPGGLYTDEATEALSAQRILADPGFRPIFLPEGGGREALFAYLVAGVFAFFGETPLALRGAAAGIGVAGVMAVWLLARRYGVLPGLAGAAWAAGSLWLICVSRDGMRNVLVPLFAAAALATLLAWHDRPGRLTGILAGATASLASLYTYQPLKLIPLLVIIWLAWLARVNRPAFHRLRVELPAFAVTFLLVAAPMIVAAALDPVSYFGRAAGVTFSPGGPVDLFGHWLRTIGMFVVTGDPNPRHDVAQLPLLGLPLFLVAVAGLARLWRRRHEAAESLVLLSLPIFMLPPLIAIEGGAPHFLRALGLAAPLAVTIGLGASEVVDQARVRLGNRPAATVAAALGVGLVALALGSGRAYLARPIPDRFEAYRYDLVAMADEARPGDVVILDDYTATVLRFLDADQTPTIVEPGTQVSIAGTDARVFALSRDDLAVAVGAGPAQGATSLVRNPAGETVVWVLAQ